MILLCSLLVALSLSQAPSAADSPGRVSGRVTVEGANTPVAGASIVLVSVGFGARRPLQQTLTGQDGRFVFDGVAPGGYRISADKTGYAPLDQARIGPVRVVAGQTIDLDLQLQKGVALAGKVLDPAGDPLAYVRILVLRRGAPPGAIRPLTPGVTPLLSGAGMQQTNDLGEFRVAGLPPGEYLIVAGPPMFARGAPAATGGAVRTTTTMTYFPGTTDQAKAQPIVVSSIADVTNIVFSMQSAPAFHVSGIVVDEKGNAVAGAVIRLMGDPRYDMFASYFGPVGSGGVRVQDNGRFEFDDVHPGSYRADALGGIINGSTDGVTGSATPGDGSAEIVVTDADINGVRVTIRSTPQGRPTPPVPPALPTPPPIAR